MSTVKAIQFRHLVSQLTYSEFHEFGLKLLDSHSQMILKSLFEHFVSSSSSAQASEIDDLNDSLSSIIRSRKEKPKQISIKNIKLDEFPKTAIGYIASFLSQRDYTTFSITNRSMYLACNSPNLLQKLDLTKVSNYGSIKLRSFPSAKSLKINALKMIKSTQISFVSPHLNNVKELTLYGRKKNGFISEFLNLNIINTHSVTTLKCVQFGCIIPRDDMSKNELLTVLRRFPNIQQLELFSLSVTDDVTAKDIANECPNLCGLTILGGYRALNNDLIAIFGTKLKYLSFMQWAKDDFDLDNVDLSKLEELRIVLPDKRSLEGILKSAKKIKKIYIKTWSFNCEGLMNKTDIKNTITTLIIKSKCMQHLSFVAKSNHFEAILDGIECGLFKTKKEYRTQIKIYITVCDIQFKPNQFTLNVGRIVNSLETANINHFMFIWVLADAVVVKDKELDEIFQDLTNLSMHIKVMKFNKTFIISNENCKINGYKDEFDEFVTMV